MSAINSCLNFFILLALSSLAFAVFENNYGLNSEDDSLGDLPFNKNNFELHNVCLTELRKQMNLEKHASLVYKQMAAHFSNVKVSKRGFAKMFDGQAKEESEHFDKFLHYINLRGAGPESFDVKMPKKSVWSSPLEALEDAIELEHTVTNEIIRIHRISDKSCKDIHLMNFLESEFIEEQISSINKLMKLHTIVKNAGVKNSEEYIIDRDLYEGKLSLDSL